MARRVDRNNDYMFKSYMADALKSAYDLNVRYADLIKPHKLKEVKYTAKEVITNIKSKLREMSIHEHGRNEA